MTEKSLLQSQCLFKIKSEINKLGRIDKIALEKACQEALFLDEEAPSSLWAYAIYSALLNQNEALLQERAHGLQVSMEKENVTTNNQVLHWLNQVKVLNALESMVFSEETIEKVYLTFQNCASKAEKPFSAIAILRKKQIEVASSARLQKTQADGLEKTNQPSKGYFKPEDFLKKAIEAYETENQMREAALHRRLLRWINLDPKVDEEGKTKLNPLPESANQQLQNDLQVFEQDPKACFLRAEQAFMLPGGQLQFDLQYLAIHSAALFDLNLSTDLKQYFILFLKKHPKAMLFQYIDGTPTANLKTRQWMQACLDSQLENHEEKVLIDLSQPDVVSEKIDWDGILKKMEQKNVAEGLRELRKLPQSSSKKVVFYRLLALSILYQQSKQEKLLDVCWEKIIDLFQSHRLIEWDKDLSIVVWEKYLHYLSQKNKVTSHSAKMVLYMEQCPDSLLDHFLGL